MIDKITERLRDKHKTVSMCITSSYCEAYNEAINDAIDIVKQVAEEHNDGWIKCSDRLPEKDGEHFLVWREGTSCAELPPRIDIAKYEKEFECFDALDTIAWQPLPEPFKESD